MNKLNKKDLKCRKNILKRRMKKSSHQFYFSKLVSIKIGGKNFSNKILDFCEIYKFNFKKNY